MLDRKTSVRILFLALVLTAASGFRFRCYWLCTDQTGIQEDYVEQRDQCRQFAQLKYDAMAGGGAVTVQSRDAVLIKLFAECMGQHGWRVPAGENVSGPVAAGPPPPPHPAPAGTATTKHYSYEETTTTPAGAPQQNAVSDKAALRRHTECDFARNAAPVSHIAADRAAACDAECKNALKANPGGPLPPACPANYPRPAVTAAVVTHKVTKEAKVSPAPARKAVPKPKPRPAPAPAKPPVVATKPPAMSPMPAPPPLPPKPAARPRPAVQPPVPVSVVTPPETTASSLLSGLLGADIALVLILLALYAAQRYARRKPPAKPRRIPSLSAKIRGRSED